MIGLEHGKVTLYDHDPEWNKEAERTIKILKDILGNIVIEIAHVGSTAINCIKAKPIIDIAVAVVDFSDIICYNQQLEKHGFYYRYAMDDADNILRKKTDFTGMNIRQLLYACGGYYNGANNLQTHFIHVVKANSTEWRNYISFRDYLNAHPNIAKEYETLKKNLCAQFPDSREKYVAHKHNFIQDILNSVKP